MSSTHASSASPTTPMDNQFPDTRSTSQRERRRTNGRACVTCHQRKVRCDILIKGTPCTNCSSQDREGCRIYQKKKRQYQTVVAPTRSQVPVPIQPRGKASGRTPIDLLPQPETALSRRSFSTTEDTPSIHGRVSPSSPSHESNHTEADGDENQGSGNLAEFIDGEDLRASAINRSGRICYIGTEVSNFHHLIQQSSRKTNLDNVLHMRNRQLAKKYTMLDIQSVPPEALKRPDKKLADELIRAYFTHVNPGWPIVDEQEFMAYYNDEIPRCKIPLPLLNAVFLVGVHVLAPSRPELKSMQSIFFRRAKMLIDCRFEQDRCVYIQVALLMTWYSDGLEEIVANAWHWIGIAARTAHGLGLHRDVTNTRMLDVHKRLWVRLFWVLFQFDTIVSASYGRPQALCLDDADIPFLTPKDFEGIPGAQVDFVIWHTQLCVIISKTLKKRWALRITDAERIEASKAGDRALAHFITQLPKSLRRPVHEASPWQSTLHLSYNNILILLHRPSPTPRADDAVAHACTDLNVCSDATASMTAIMETLLAKDGFSSLWLYGLHALFTAMAHVSTEMTSESPLVAAKAERMFESLSQSLRELASRWQFAKGMLRLFQARESRLRQCQQHIAATGTPLPRNEAVSSSSSHHLGAVTAAVDQNHQIDDGEFSLRPNPMGPPPVVDSSVGGFLGPGPSVMVGAAEQGLYPAYEGFGLDAADGGMFPDDFSFHDAPALEALLAGMDGSDYLFGLTT